MYGGELFTFRIFCRYSKQIILWSLCWFSFIDLNYAHDLGYCKVNTWQRYFVHITPNQKEQYLISSPYVTIMQPSKWLMLHRINTWLKWDPIPLFLHFFLCNQHIKNPSWHLLTFLTFMSQSLCTRSLLQSWGASRFLIVFF